MVDLFHEVGLASSVPNCRTTIFTFHCVACWYIGNVEVRNTHYSRHRQVEQRIKTNHNKLTTPAEKESDADKGIVDDMSSFLMSDAYKEELAIQQDILNSQLMDIPPLEDFESDEELYSDEEATELRDEYSSISDSGNDGDSKEGNVRDEILSNDSIDVSPGDSDTTPQPDLKPEAGNDSDAAEDIPLTATVIPDDSQTDVTAETAIEMENDEAS